MMQYNFDSFPGFTAEDFDAFAERKWSSNRFNLERMQTRARFHALERELEPHLGEVLEPLVFQTTLDHPHIFNRNKVRSMWLYLDRPHEERMQLSRVVDKDLSLREKVEDSVPQHHVAIAGIGLDHEQVGPFFRLHANALLDKRNLLARLAEHAEQQHLAVLFSRLPEGTVLSIADETLPMPVDATGIAELAGRLESFAGYFTISHGLAPDEAIEAGATLIDSFAAWLPAFLDVWRFAAWSRENDRLKLARALKEEKKQKARRLSGFEEGDKVRVVSGLLSGKEGTVQSVDLKGRVKVQFGHLHMDMEARLLKRM